MKSSKRKKPSRAKRFWDMNTAELKEATAEFDREFVGETFGEPSPTQKTQLERAKRNRGRPRKGKGALSVCVSLERGLLKTADRLAKRHRMHRSRLIARGLEALINEEIPVEV